MKLICKHFLILAFVFISTGAPSIAQCSMCRAVAESGKKDDSTRVAKGLNHGILYLLAMPYVLGGVAYIIWRKNKKQST